MLSAALTAAVLALSVSGPAVASEGDVRVVKITDSSFDRFTLDPAPALRATLRRRYDRMVSYTPYFDTRTSWYPDALVYQDLYAIYRGDALAQRRPEWILRDGRGKAMYIPWGCERGVCPQYAGDVGNPQFRRWWIDKAKRTLAKGYRGVWVDDVNLEFRVSDGRGREQAPIDPRTRRPMTAAAWRRYVADFTVQIRRELPGAEIVHNAIWFAGGDERDRDPHVARQLRSADAINLERGANDDGLTGGTDEWSLRTFLEFIDRRHADGKSVILDGGGRTATTREYELAAYLLVSRGGDRISSGGSDPDRWWNGFNVSLGKARGDRYEWNGVLRRDFEHGTVLLNEPDAETKRLALPAGLRGLDGRPRTAVTLAGKRGAVLLSPAAVAAAATKR